ncbi:MAG: hypothetical protein ACJ8BW_01990 [Ktedonobacteraceae bacterium]|jgi:hypothetical protein
MPDNETAAIPVDEPVKPSKLKRIKDVAITTGIIVIPVALSAASVYYTVKMGKIQLDTAKLNLEAAAKNAAKA